MASTRWTETPNPLTLDLDVAPSDLHLVRLLAAADAGLFSSQTGLPALADAETVRLVAQAAALVADALRHPCGRVAFGGCGTSGRLSHLEARALNALAARRGLRGDCFTYLLAGGDAALVMSQEAAEDRPDAGRDAVAGLLADVAEASRSGDGTAAPVVVVGISCGLSATYVGSMLEYALRQPPEARVSSVAVGFNPVDAVRDVRVEGWGSSFHDVLGDMLRLHAAAGTGAAPRAIVLNPVVGPEAVAGSSRMKGGSATKILVETIGLLAVSIAAGGLSGVDSVVVERAAQNVLAGFELAVRSVYRNASELASLVSTAATALTSAAVNETAPSEGQIPDPGDAFMSRTGHGRVIYLGVGSAGLLGLIDASECPPTYGSLFNDVRGFLGGGWEELGNKAGRHVSSADGKALCLPPHLRGDKGWPSAAATETVELGVREGFLNRDVLSSLNAADMVVLIAIYGDGTGLGGASDCSASPNLLSALEGLAAAKRAGCAVRHILVGLDEGSAAGSAEFEATVSATAPNGVRLSVRSSAVLDASLGLPPESSSRFAQQLALKLALNALTTGSHVRKGTIVRNRMVNVCLTNAKLFHRAVGIVADVAGCCEAVARTCVIRAIYGADEGDQITAAESRSVLEHVAAASPQRMLVPVAILLATKGGSVANCAALLQAQPVIRLALAKQSV